MSRMLDERRKLTQQLLMNAAVLAGVTLPRVDELLERGCFNHAVNLCHAEGCLPMWGTIMFLSDYSAQSAKLIHNLELALDGYRDFAEALSSGRIDPRIAAGLVVEDLNPGSLLAERTEINLRERVQVVGHISTKYKCPKCGERSTHLRDEQIRCADEGSTGFADCTICKFTWKIY